MSRLLGFIITVIILSFLALWISETSGTVAIDWQGYRIETSTAVLLSAAITLALIAIGLYALIHWTRHIPERVHRAFADRRRDKGYAMLMEGFTAIAASDGTAAKKLAQKSSKLLPSSSLPLLLSAQTAQFEGDEQEAERCYRAMLTHDDSEFLGLRGLLVQAHKHGKSDEKSLEKALALAEQAYQKRPSTPWVVQTLVEYYSRLGKWQEAELRIRQSMFKGVVDKHLGKHLLAVIHYEQGQALFTCKELDAALQHALQASRNAPDFIPGMHLLASIHIQREERSKALKALEKAWKHAPHPELAKLYAGLAKDTAPDKTLKHCERLIKHNPGHSESHILIATMAITARQWATARNHIKSALTIRETVRVCKLMVQLKEEEQRSEEGADTEGEAITGSADDWRERALNADPDPQWLCTDCGSIQQQWHILCPHCYAFDSIRWQSPKPYGKIENPLYLPHA